MLVKETFISFTGMIDSGRYSFFIEVNKDGVNNSVDDLINYTSHFPRIVIFNSPFIEKDELVKLIKKTQKHNNDVIFELHSDGCIKPNGLASLGNIIYYTHLKLKNSGIEYEKRIIDGSVNWFITADSNFIFEVNSEDDVDEVNLLVLNLSINKSKVFISPMYDNGGINLDFIIRQAKRNGFNIGIDLRKSFWNNEGKNINNGGKYDDTM